MKKREKKKLQDELNKKVELEKAQKLEAEGENFLEINKYECYIDKRRFKNEEEYINHFNNYHPEDYPFYCYEFQKGFYSSYDIEKHYNIYKRHKYY